MAKQTGAPPRHVGIIMDGNGRWAAKRGLPRKAGHRQGAKAFEEIVRYANGRKLEVLTVYAFSRENRSRPPDEVEAILALLREYLDRLEKHRSDSGRIRFLGDLDWLDSTLRERIRRVERESDRRAGMRLNIAFHYSGREEILRAARELARRAMAGTAPDLETLDEHSFGELLYTKGQPDVDLVIRTSGEKRVSNFLLWQSAYAEYVFTDTLWPDFTPRHLEDALEEYARRDRRLGGL